MIDPALPDRPEAALTDRLLRQFGGLCVAVLGLLAWWEARAHETAAAVLAGLAVLLGLLAVVMPRALAPLYNLLLAITFPIGLIVSNVTLAVGWMSPLVDKSPPPA